MATISSQPLKDALDRGFLMTVQGMIAIFHLGGQDIESSSLFPS